jgi:hypothetical protein
MGQGACFFDDRFGGGGNSGLFLTFSTLSAVAGRCNKDDVCFGVVEFPVAVIKNTLSAAVRVSINTMHVIANQKGI